MNNLYMVSVIYNGIKWYKACLESVLQAGVAEDRIILVENASPDGTGEAIARDFPRIQMIRMEKNVGAAAGANIGIQKALEAGASHVMLLNIDVTISPDMPRILLETMAAHPDYGIISPVQYNYSGEKLDANFARMHSLEKINSAEDGLLEAETVIGAGVLMLRRTYETIGGFDETYFVYGEEDDFCRRARMHGIKIGVATKATMRHWHMAINAKPSPRVRKLRFRNQFLYEMKDPSHALSRHLYYYLRYYALARTASAARRGDWRGAATVMGVHLQLLPLVPRILWNRRQERKGRWHL